ncbi:MAG: hypothetical protein AB8G77_01360 [Rhodothermales bacterium]
MKKKALFISQTIVLLALVFFVHGCQTIKEIANLRNVDFALGAVSNLRLAGVNLDGVTSVKDVRATDIVKLTAAVLRNDLPISFSVDLKAENPSDNTVAARLTRMDWTLFLDDKETISGALEEEHVLNPGQPIRIPVDISFELTDFFDNPVRDLIDLASSVRGEDGSAARSVKLVATPIISTLIGPIRYPEPITVVSETIGG